MSSSMVDIPGAEVGGNEAEEKIMKGLTAKQSEILDYLVTCIESEMPSHL